MALIGQNITYVYEKVHSQDIRRADNDKQDRLNMTRKSKSLNMFTPVRNIGKQDLLKQNKLNLFMEVRRSFENTFLKLNTNETQRQMTNQAFRNNKISTVLASFLMGPRSLQNDPEDKDLKTSETSEKDLSD